MKIKTIYFWLSFMFLLVLTNACDDSFLESYPIDQLTTATYYQNDEDFDKAVTGVYNSFTTWRQQLDFFPMLDMATPVAVMGGGRFRAYHNGNSGFAPTSGIPALWWSCYWVGVGRANEVLKQIQDKGASISTDALRNRYKGEVLFLRAQFYFFLTYLWGDVPLITEPVSDNLYPEKAPHADIVEQMIADLQEAETLLPSVAEYRTNSELLGRASKGAAMSLLGKIYCFEKRWSEGAAELKKVIDSGEYELTQGPTGFNDQFWASGENGPESIFEVQYTSGQDDNLGNGFITYCATAGTGIDEAGAGYNYLEPTEYLTDMYETSNGYAVKSTWVSAAASKDSFSYESADPAFDPLKPFENRDPRLKWTVMYEGSPYIGEKFPANTFTAASPAESNFATVKYIVHQTTGMQSDMNLIVMRYADVLLLYAEALMEQNTLSEAVTYVNMVRNRPSVNMPGVPSAIAADQGLLRNYIHQERIRELACEYGHVYFDLIRWGTWVDQMNNYWVANRHGATNAAATFNDHNTLWPIPQDEMDLNPNLVQNDGY
jgi:starch-binding outer membrane protein, SusD/RagB family